MLARVRQTTIKAFKLAESRGVAQNSLARTLFAASASRQTSLWGRKKKAKASAAAVQQEVVEEVDDGAEFDMDTLEEELRVQVEYMERELAKVRGSTTSPTMLDHIQVDAYGEMTPLNGVAQVVMKTPQLLIVNPYDNSLCENVRAALFNADIGLNPIVEESYVKVPIPKASKETRDTAMKQASQLAEETKRKIRAKRKRAVDKLKGMTGIGADLQFKMLKDVQDVTTKFTDEASNLLEAKKAEIST